VRARVVDIGINVLFGVGGERLSKINNFDSKVARMKVVIVDEEVGGFDIAMNDARLVKSKYGVDYLFGNIDLVDILE
jgi:hypothetical protein